MSLRLGVKKEQSLVPMDMQSRVASVQYKLQKFSKLARRFHGMVESAEAFQLRKQKEKLAERREQRILMNARRKDKLREDSRFLGSDAAERAQKNREVRTKYKKKVIEAEKLHSEFHKLLTECFMTLGDSKEADAVVMNFQRLKGEYFAEERRKKIMEARRLEKKELGVVKIADEEDMPSKKKKGKKKKKSGRKKIDDFGPPASSSSEDEDANDDNETSVSTVESSMHQWRSADDYALYDSEEESDDSDSDSEAEMTEEQKWQRAEEETKQDKANAQLKQNRIQDALKAVEVEKNQKTVDEKNFLDQKVSFNRRDFMTRARRQTRLSEAAVKKAKKNPYLKQLEWFTADHDMPTVEYMDGGRHLQFESNVIGDSTFNDEYSSDEDDDDSSIDLDSSVMTQLNIHSQSRTRGSRGSRSSFGSRTHIPNKVSISKAGDVRWAGEPISPTLWYSDFNKKVSESSRHSYFDYALRRYLTRKFISEYSMSYWEVPFPHIRHHRVGATLGENLYRPVFYSRNINDCKGIMVLVPQHKPHISHGVWSRAVSVCHSVSLGSMINWITEAKSREFAVVILNPNLSFIKVTANLSNRDETNHEPIPILLPQNSEPFEHIKYVWAKCIARYAEDKPVVWVGHLEGCDDIMHLMDEAAFGSGSNVPTDLWKHTAGCIFMDCYMSNAKQEMVPKKKSKHNVNKWTMLNGSLTDWLVQFRLKDLRRVRKSYTYPICFNAADLRTPVLSCYTTTYYHRYTPCACLADAMKFIDEAYPKWISIHGKDVDTIHTRRRENAKMKAKTPRAAKPDTRVRDPAVGQQLHNIRTNNYVGFVTPPMSARSDMPNKDFFPENLRLENIPSVGSTDSEATAFVASEGGNFHATAIDTPTSVASGLTVKVARDIAHLVSATDGDKPTSVAAPIAAALASTKYDSNHARSDSILKDTTLADGSTTNADTLIDKMKAAVSGVAPIAAALALTKDDSNHERNDSILKDTILADGSKMNADTLIDKMKAMGSSMDSVLQPTQPLSLSVDTSVRTSGAWTDTEQLFAADDEKQTPANRNDFAE